MKKVLILGAYSAIAYETAKILAKEGAELYLVGRSGEKVKAMADDLLVRGAQKAEIYTADLSQVKHHGLIIENALKALDNLDAVLIAYGTPSDQETCEKNPEETAAELQNNFVSIVSFLTLLANYMEKQKHGCLAVISSVAGDRGRQSNYVYGTAKGALNVFLQGLRNRLFRSGVSVVTIKPGFVDTPMTASLKKNLLFADPAKVGKIIYKAMKKGKSVVYVPWFWRWIMAIIKCLPEAVFKRLKL